jgi:5'-nucleotidase
MRTPQRKQDFEVETEMKLLLTNDDGIDAPGLEALYQVDALFGEPVLVAPMEGHSGCSHRVTTGRPIRVIRRQPDRFVVEGTPADCVRLALHSLAADAAWVLAGLNEGGNLGADVHHSGTVAAVREAVLHGKPGIALSHYHKGNLPIDWRRAARWVQTILADLLARPWTPGTFWNINLPHLDPDQPDPETIFCPLDPGPLPLSYRAEGDSWHYDGNYHQRARMIGSDVDVCFAGNIAVTRITVT